MKTITLLIALLSFPLSAVELTITGPCGESTNFAFQTTANLEESVGHHTIKVFTEFEVPFIGTEAGLNSILNTPTGTDGYDIISDKKMRVFGWCYRVNGFEPAVMANQYMFENQSDELLWIYGYSTYENGQWVGYCDPAFEIVDESEVLKKLCK